MPGYALHCTVCGDCFETRRDWLTHLLRRKHQDLARREVGRWDEVIKEHVIVAFSSFPVGSLEFLEHFSKGSFIASDFVFWEERPRLGFVFLESSKRVTRMLDLGLEVRIHGQIVHLKRASDYLQSELDHLMAANTTRNETISIKIETSECPPKKGFDDDKDTNANGGSTQVQELMEIDSSHSLQKYDDMGPCNNNNSTSLNAGYALACKVECNVGSKGMNEDEGQMDNQITAGLPCENQSPLIKAYNHMCASIQIPEEEYTTKLNLVAALEKVLALRIPPCKLYMFRYCHLRLQNLARKELLIFMDYAGKISQGGHWPSMKTHIESSQFMYPTRELFNILDFPNAQLVRDADKPEGSEKYGSQFILKGFRFSLVPDARFIVETQTCRLLEHMCTYDSRARPLIVMIKYWTECNQIRLSSSLRNKQEEAKSYDFPVEGAALEWLVMVFLFHKTGVPTARQVQTQRRHIPIMISKHTDIGFCDERLPVKDPEVSEEFIMDIMTLAKEFFEFYAQLRSGKWIINTRDAEVIRMEIFFRTTGVYQLSKLAKHGTEQVYNFSKLARYEVNQIYQIPRREKNVIVVQPLDCSKYFPIECETFQNHVCLVMQCTAEKLSNSLGAFKDPVNFHDLLSVTPSQLQTVKGLKQQESASKPKRDVPKMNVNKC